MRSLLILDLDGTLVDSSHRRIYEKDKVKDDKVKEDVLNTVRTVIFTENPYVCILTARSENDYNITVKWLEKKNIFFDRIFFKPLDYKGSGFYYKKEVYNMLLKPHFDKVIVFEDNKKIADYFHKEGCLVFQIKEEGFRYGN